MPSSTDGGDQTDPVAPEEEESRDLPWTPPIDPESDPVRRKPRGAAQSVVHKSDLTRILAERMDVDVRTAAYALEAVIDTITRQLAAGERIAITGFGSFEKVLRNARWARNPRTGERFRVPRVAVPKFTPGADFLGVVSGARALPRTKVLSRQATSESGATVTTTAARTAAKKTTAKKTTAARTAAKKTAAKKTAAKQTAAKQTAAKQTAAKQTAAKKTTAKTPAKKASPRTVSSRREASKGK